PTRSSGRRARRRARCPPRGAPRGRGVGWVRWREAGHPPAAPTHGQVRAAGGTGPHTPPPAPPTSTAPTGLKRGLIEAFGQAQASAADVGLHLTITSGFRTAEEQAALLRGEGAERGPHAER